MSNQEILIGYFAISAAFSIRMLVVLFLSYAGLMYKDDESIQGSIGKMKDALEGPAMEAMPVLFSFLAAAGTVLVIIVSGMAWPVSVGKKILKLVSRKN